MSNNTNLSKLANVLDDGSSGQYLKSTGSGGVVFDTVAAGTTTVADITALEALSAAQGDMAFVLSNDNVYIRKTAGWYKIAQVTNNQLHSVTVTMSGGGTAGDPYLLALDGTDTLATGAATDPEGLSVTWSAAPISPATLSGSNIVVSSVNVATITQGTGANSNVFTLDPVATTGTHNFSLRFSVTDGINATINADKDYTLNFITTIADSKYTTMLAQAVGANNGTNSSLTDSSSGSHTFTNTGSPVAGTFSPYRSGGYSVLFDGSGDYLENTQGTGIGEVGSGPFCIEAWVYKRSNSSFDSICSLGSSAGSYQFEVGENSDRVRWETHSGAVATSTTTLNLNEWYHVAVSRDSSNNLRLYVNGTKEDQVTNTENYNDAGPFEIGRNRGSSDEFDGYIQDLRIVIGSSVYEADTITVPTEPLTAITNTNLLTCHLPYITDGSTNGWELTVNGDVSTKPFSPYDYIEYDAADHGGSIYFPVNTGTRLSSASSSLELGTGNFTIEGWVYHKLDGATNSSYLFDYRIPPNSGSYHSFLYIENSVFKYGYGAYSQQITSGTVKENQWYHWAVCRSGTNTKLFLNGKQAGSTFTGDNVNYQGQQPYIGRHNNVTSLNAKGYLSDVRITKSDLYTADFTPPTAPLASTNSVLHIKGTDAAIIDKSGSANLELVGDTKCSTAQVKFAGSKSMYFDGSGDRATATGVPDLGDDFTIECWVYSTTTGNRGIVSSIDNIQSWSGSGYWSLYVGGGNYPQLIIDGGTTTANSTTLPTNQWVHLAVTRTSNTVRYFINGTVQSTTFSNSLTLKNPSGIVIGSSPNNNYIYNYTGYIQDLRIANECKYTATFTPPTAPLEG
jgi:hypothetical protein